MPTLLELKGLTKHFGGLAAVDQFDMYVNRGEIVGLIGPNGAGKTTVFNLITGIYLPTYGRVIYDKIDITGEKPLSLFGRIKRYWYFDFWG